MKRLTLLPIILIWACSAIAQDEDFSTRWSIFVAGKDLEGEYFELSGEDVNVHVMYKNLLGEVIYSEDHTGILDFYSYLTLDIGKGMNPVPGPLTKEIVQDIHSLCWKATVDLDAGPVMIEGEDELFINIRSRIADEAKNSQKLDGNIFDDELLDIIELLSAPDDVTISFLTHDVVIPGGRIRGVALRDLVRSAQAPSIETGEMVDLHCIGTGDQKPIVFGKDIPEELRDFYTVCIPYLEALWHGLAIKLLGTASPTTSHNTAAIFADNTQNDRSAGVLAQARTWGVYGSAANGIVGVSTGDGNGAGISGIVGAAPASGGFKYAIYGNSQSQPSSWAGAFFGNGFYTGTWTMSSDARLKTEIRSQTSSLDKILQLKPSSYFYRQDTPYNLPQGLHHGFIAQEMEQVLPELVTDIEMPLNPDPQEMYKGGSTPYKGINYIEVISLLTGAVQEMNASFKAQLDAQAKEIEELKKMILEIQK
jgi:hypothetical protein